MNTLAAALGLFLVAITLWDAYETVLLPRRLPGDIRISRLVLRNMWLAWSSAGRRIRAKNRRELFLSLYPQLSLIVLLAIWALGLIFSFALMQWGAGSRMQAPAGLAGFAADLYLSGTTFFTLGLGDVAPMSGVARLLVVMEAGLGFGFLALVIAYVPVLYQAFARREARITMLDQWGGSPPAAALILKRAFESGDPGETLDRLFREWEVTAAEILESHLSYPTLAFFRSQHDNQSWLASLSAVLDTSALVSAGIHGLNPFQSRLTFAMCRHTLVDVSQVFRLRPGGPEPEGPARERLAQLRSWLERNGVPIDTGPDSERTYRDLRDLYSPYLNALAGYLLMSLPDWLPPDKARFNWRTTAMTTGAHHGDH
jgi:hypothetical protein